MNGSKFSKYWRTPLIFWGVFLVNLFFAQLALSQLKMDIYSGKTSFSVTNSNNGKKVLIFQKSRADKRVYELSVFESFDDGKKLRKLHEFSQKPLADTFATSPLITNCGRFAITLGETGFGLGDRSMVIYDFVRKTSKPFALEDFLPKQTIDELRPHPVFGGRDWNRSWVVDNQRLLFYPTLPGNRIGLRKKTGNQQKLESGAIANGLVPSVVVDLINMSACVKPIPQWTGELLEKQNIRDGLYSFFSAVRPADGYADDATLPGQLRRQIYACETRDEVSKDKLKEVLLYRLNPKTGEYHQVDQKKAPATNGTAVGE